jgi:hypothetical protein
MAALGLHQQLLAPDLACSLEATLALEDQTESSVCCRSQLRGLWALVP